VTEGIVRLDWVRLVRSRSRYLFCLSRIRSRCRFLRASASGPVSKAHARPYSLAFSAFLDGWRSVSVSIVRDRKHSEREREIRRGANRVMSLWRQESRYSSQASGGTGNPRKIFVLRSGASFVFSRLSLLLSYVSCQSSSASSILPRCQMDTPLSFVEQKCQDMCLRSSSPACE
jgi:hypothetical protein